MNPPSTCYRTVHNVYLQGVLVLLLLNAQLKT